jgi:hypothetical protein
MHFPCQVQKKQVGFKEIYAFTETKRTFFSLPCSMIAQSLAQVGAFRSPTIMQWQQQLREFSINPSSSFFQELFFGFCRTNDKVEVASE